MSGLYEAATWLVYVLAALTVLAAAVAAVLTGLALRLAAEFLRELVGGDNEGGTRQAGDDPGPSTDHDQRTRGDIRPRA